MLDKSQFERSEMIFGKDKTALLHNSKVLVVGLGGVGGYVVESLVRSGIGSIGLVDNDVISLSNLNRQIIATHSTIGLLKTDAFEKRIIDINPDALVTKYPMFFDPTNSSMIDFDSYDYVVDAIDSTKSKIELIRICIDKGIPIISSMGTGNKTDPSKLQISDISKTHTCPLARVIRRELHRVGINHLPCVFSTEEIITRPIESSDDKHIIASTSFVPPVAGLLISSYVIKELTA